MRLSDLAPAGLAAGNFGDVEVIDVQVDSRQCGPGSMFFAMPGATTSGSVFVDDAVGRGALAVVTAEEVETSVPSFVVDETELQALLVAACATVSGHPEQRLRLLGVTGTNGKTSVTTVFAALWRALGRPSDVIGTLTHERTTPAPPELFRDLAGLAESGDRQALMAIEVSSHALTQGRVDGLFFDVAAFTNLSLDHLDYHGSMEAYFKAKAELFTPERCARAVIFTENEYGRRLAAAARVPVTRVGRAEATDASFAVGETTFTWRGRSVRTALTGEYNLDNALIVLTCATELGVSEDDAAAALAQATSVDGRFEVVRKRAPTVVVDYAHTPDALERLLLDARWIAREGRVIVVFGCGGNRDRTKRPQMGAVATRLADLTYVTSDNPRFEDAEAIIDEIVAGLARGAHFVRESDRRSAIGAAIAAANEDDVVVIAGKGHEKTQIIGPTVLDFDDRAVAREFVKEIEQC
jgi:UDP-N-acetylmuramoyl-L-alanyl-D-glutamate--2,6-diaminopimelate ligase